MKDKQRLDWLDAITHTGAAPNLVYDDDGHFAVSFCGSQECPRGNGEGFDHPVDICAFVKPKQWKSTVREAIDYAMKSEASHE